MARRRTTGEQISDLEKKMEQMAAQKKQLMARKKEEDRKARNRRLIIIGAEVEKILGKTNEKKDLPKLRRFLNDQERRGKYFSNAMRDKEAEDSGETLSDK